MNELFGELRSLLGSPQVPKEQDLVPLLLKAYQLSSDEYNETWMPYLSQHELPRFRTSIDEYDAVEPLVPLGFELSIELVGVSESDLERLNSMSFAKLTHFEVHMYFSWTKHLEVGEVEFLRFLSRPDLSNLQFILLHGMGLSERFFEQFFQINFPKLRVLRLSQNRIGDAAIEVLTQAKYLNNIIFLDFRYNELKNKSCKLLAECAGLTGLTGLALGYNKLTVVGIEHLCKSQHLINLKYLNLIAVRMGTRGTEALAKSYLIKNLKMLNLMFNDLDDDAIEIIATHPGFGGVTHLGLRNNDITNDGVLILSKSKTLNELIYIDFYHNWLDRQCVPYLDNPEGLPKLQCFEIRELRGERDESTFLHLQLHLRNIPEYH